MRSGIELCQLLILNERVGKKKSETDSSKSKISSRTSRGKNSTNRHHHRHHQRQPGEQQFLKMSFLHEFFVINGILLQFYLNEVRRGSW